MHPCYFGDSTRPLFGIYHPPRSQRVRDTAVLLCYPIAQEYIRAHRAFSQLSNMMATAGFHVFRFDYFATGDSAGDSGEGNLDKWKTDIHTAVHELKDMSGAPKISMVGLRVGAVLACAVSTDGVEVEDLVLWDPVVNGKTYLHRLRAMHRAMLDSSDQSSARRAPAGYADFDELLGFPFPAQMFSDIEQIDLLHTQVLTAARTLLMVSEEKEEYAKLRQRLATVGRPFDYRVIPGNPRWDSYEDHDAILMPYEMLQTITRALAPTAL